MAFLTDAGLQKLAVATPLQPINVKFMAVGSGTGTPTQNMSALFNEQYRTEIGSPTRNESDPKVLEFEGYIPTNVGGFTITEIGLFDDAGVLIAYDLLSEGVVKAAPTSALKTDIYPTVLVALSNTAQTELIVSQSTQFDHQRMSNRNAADCHSIAAITGLIDALNSKVALTSDQVINGIKTFNNLLKFASISSLDGESNIYQDFDGLYLSNKNTSLIIDGTNNQFFFNGKIVGDGSGIYRASTTDVGVTKLNNTLTSPATDEAATAAAVKSLNDTKKAVAVLSGTIANGETLPLPNGYTEDQCKFMVSTSDTTLVDYGGNNLGQDSLRIKCFLTGRVVTSTISFYNPTTNGVYDKAIDANYIVIGVK